MRVSSYVEALEVGPGQRQVGGQKHSSVCSGTERRGKKRQHLVGLILWSWRAIAAMTQPTFF